MVFFTCSYCGESVKKPSVAKHYLIKCRNKIPFLTCVDCLKDFKGNEHEAHVKCLTEEERYSAKGFVPKASSNKGERKQKAWSECAHGLLSSGSLESDEKSLLEVIVKFDNLPRKKAKFMNFLKNTARQYLSQPNLIDRVWEKLENYFKESNSENQTSGNSQDPVIKNGKEKCEKEVKDQAEEKVEERAEEGVTKKKKKRKKDSMNEEEMNKEKNEDKKKKNKTGVNVIEEGEPEIKKSKKCEEEKSKINESGNLEEDEKNEGNETSFDWKDTILNVISAKGDNNQILLKKLQKKVLNKYCKRFECQVSDKITRKFMKKLKKMSEDKRLKSYCRSFEHLVQENIKIV